ncbi:hypothetical protein V6246_00750 [Algibacter sp. TI.3.09]|uniref:hypothetical protein n=1 Tax=Algibacter sp. TI.3.09 TaxID=3121298 RepID=UPI00311F3483
MNINDFVKKHQLDRKGVISVAKKLGIKGAVYLKDDQNRILAEVKKYEAQIDTTSSKKEFMNSDLEKRNKELDQRENKIAENEKILKQFHEKILQEKNDLAKEKLKFESYKKSETNALKIKLSGDELNHTNNLESLKIKTLNNLNDDFITTTKVEYDKIKTKLDDVIQRERKLHEWQQEIDTTKTKLESEKTLFESQKEKLLSEHKQLLQNQKVIFNNDQEKEKVKIIEEANQKIKELYKDKEQEINKKTESLKELEEKLKNKKATLSAKEKSLESKGDEIYIKEKDRVNEELRNLQAKVDGFENANHQLREELSNAQEELDACKKYKGRNLPLELDEKQKELDRTKKSLADYIEQKNDLATEKEANARSYEQEKDVLLNDKEQLLSEVLEVTVLKNEKALLEDKVKSSENHLEFLQGENKDLNDRLNAIYSDGTEIEERIKDLKQKPYREIKLDTEIKITDEIKYLDGIQKNMKDYGLEYPKRLLYAFHTALKSADFSPLTVLSGVSGTGKSELPKLYSHFGGFNFLAEAVQPTWDSPSSMLGFYNTIDRKFDSTNILKFLVQTSQSKTENPFGLKESMNMILLDEMNLAHIELYFAEFLSKFELRRGSKGVNLDVQLGTGMNYGLPLDNNVLWLGTMNEDETTKSLSDKVLDRAFSINFPRPIDLKSRTKLKSLEEIKQFEYLNKNTWDGWIQKESLFIGDKTEILKNYHAIANKINEELAPTGRAIGHRVWQSMEFYMSNHPLVIQNIDNEQELNKNVKLAFEEQLVQKIMPKLRGIEVHGKEKDALVNIKDILNQKKFNIVEDFDLSMDNPYGQFIWNSANYLKED